MVEESGTCEGLGFDSLAGLDKSVEDGLGEHTFHMEVLLLAVLVEESHHIRDNRQGCMVHSIVEEVSLHLESIPLQQVVLEV